MTQEIYLSIAGKEHMTKQPPGKRYALFCKDALGDTYGLDCEARGCGGHIGDYEDYLEAKITGIDHPHSVLIKYYPDSKDSAPSRVFLQDWGSLSADRKII